MAPLYPAFAICAALALGPDTTRQNSQQAPAHLFRGLGRWALGIGFAISGLLYWHALRPVVPLPATVDAESLSDEEFEALVDSQQRELIGDWVSNYVSAGPIEAWPV